ncbi:MAG: DUF2157 domain-containing protein [Agitococcus sp.]
MTPSRAKSLLQQWTAQQKLPPQQINQALNLANVTPTPQHWFSFLDKLLLANGGGLLVIGVIFFFAFNWQQITRFHKFALIEGLVVASLAGYSYYFHKASAKFFVLAASVFVGVLLAFYGQTYQTGADTWQLFFMWALLITPWAILAQLASLWLLWLILVNLSVFLYYQVFHGIFGMLFSGDALQMALFGLNSVALCVWELAATRYQWLKGRTEVRLLAIMTGFSITWLMLSFIFGEGDIVTYVPLVYGLWLTVFYGVYRHKIKDLFMLAGASLSVIILSTAWLGEILFKAKDGAVLFLLAIWVIVTSGIVIRWLKGLAQELYHD